MSNPADNTQNCPACGLAPQVRGCRQIDGGGWECHGMSQRNERPATTSRAYSPGPWSVSEKAVWWELCAADGNRVLGFYTSDGDEPSMEDERLIVAAPEMLDLLRQCLAEDHGDHRPTCSPIGECFHRKIGALLARIDGGA